MKVVVDISDAQVSNKPDDVIITYSLGSCIGVSLYDQQAKVGGMLHFQLPSAKVDIAKSKTNPMMFADTGMNHLVEKMAALGGVKKRMTVKIAGGAQMMSGAKAFQIGKRNYASIRQLLWKNGMFIDSEDIGGEAARTMTLNVADGDVQIKSKGITKQL